MLRTDHHRVHTDGHTRPLIHSVLHCDLEGEGREGEGKGKRGGGKSQLILSREYVSSSNLIKC